MFGLFKREERKVTNFSSYIPNLLNNIFAKETYIPTQITTVYSSARVISSTIADTELRTKNTRIQKMLDNPNPFMTKFNLIGNIVSDLVLKGNSFVYIKDNQLWFIPYDQVSIYITTEYQEPLYYQITYFGESYIFYPEDMLHFKNPLSSLSSNGYIGINPIEHHRKLLDVNFSEQDYLQSFNENAAQVQLVIETDKRLNPEAVENFQKQFKKKVTGTKNAGSVPLLHDGLKAKQLSKISPADADFIRTTELSKSEIAEIFGVPRSLLGIGEAKYSNYEAEVNSFHQFTLNPIMKSIQEEMTKKLMPITSTDIIEFKPNALKYASSDEKSKALSLLRNTSIITSNEARSFYDLPEIASDEANKLVDELNINDSKESEVLNSIPEPNNQMEVDANPNQLNQLSKELQRSMDSIKSQLGRLTKELNEVRSKID